MKKISVLLLILTLLLFSLGCNIDLESHRERRSFEKDYYLLSELDIATSAGDIVVDNWDKDYIKINAIIKGYAENQDKALELVRNTKIDFSYFNKELKVRKNDQQASFNKNVTVEYRIMTPEEFSANLATSSGDVKIEKQVGDLEIATSSGEITIKDLNGDLNSNTSSGDLQVGDLKGALEHRSSSGDVEIDFLDGKVDIETSSGDVEGIFDLGATSNRINLSSGEAMVDLAPDPSLELLLTTSSGDIDITDINLDILKLSDEVVKGVIASGDGQLEINTSSGDINLSERFRR
jgi:hypothetical protein